MTRLTEKQYWESLYDDDATSDKKLSQASRIKGWLKRLMGQRLIELISPYDDYLLWHTIFPGYLPVSCEGLSVVEIGSAPGEFLVRFAKTFGAEPYGLEYARNGAERNRQIFAENGFNPRNVIEADFFSEDLSADLTERFDIVISRGFIEHFEDVDAVVSRHVELLRPGGLLFVLIPNLLGVYHPWTRLFNPQQLPMHNLELMKLPKFRSAFGDVRLEALRCSYFGTFSFWMFTAPSDARWTNRMIRIFILLQRGLNFFFRFAFSGRGCESAIFSPNLIFVGRKKGK